MNVRGRVALVTGSGRGIGAEIVQRLAVEGARTAVCDVNREAAENMAAAIRERGGESIAISCDTTDKGTVDAMVARTVEHYGRLDILVNNVGIIRDNYLTKLTEADWDAVLNVNLKSYFLCSQAAARVMMEQEYGRIVSISSRAWQGNRAQANYSAAKGGVVSLTRTMALELGKFNITCNCVAPGVIDTAMTRSLRPDVLERNLSAQPIRKIGQPGDVAYAVLFFASDEAWYISGQTLYVCGGKSVGALVG